jgi:holdfast attachment protein HfaA
MAVALLGCKQLWNTAMTHSKKIFAVLIFALSAASAAQAADFSNSASYNGFGASTMNTASNYSMRDANGNLTLVNGQIEPSTYSNSTGSQFASTSGGVGTSGAGTAYGQATAIGNSLNVVVVGSHNTTIIDSAQTNTGNQTATADLTTH